MTTTQPARRRRIEPDNVEAPFDIDEEAAPRPAAARRKAAPAAFQEAPPEKAAAILVEDEEEEAPKPRKRGASSRAMALDEEEDEPSGDVVQMVFGRDAVASAIKKSSVSNNFFKFDDETQEPLLVRFLDEEYGMYLSRWVKRKGRMSFPQISEDDPLARLGIVARKRFVFQLVNYSHDNGPTVQTWDMGKRAFDILLGLDKDKRNGPLPRHYYAMSRTPKDDQFDPFTYQIQVVKERDLEEEWGINPDDARKFYDQAAPFPPEKLAPRVTLVELQQVADEQMGLA